MKKIFVFALALCAAVIFAQESDAPENAEVSAGAESVEQQQNADNGSKSGHDYIVEEHLMGEHPWDEVYFTKEKVISETDGSENILSINFYPYTNEAIFSYNCSKKNFTENNLIHSLTLRLKEFQMDNNFIGYWYTRPQSYIDMPDGTVSCMFFVAFEVYKPQP